MHYFSTRGLNEKISAAEAIIRGLAPDGGLYVPESFPHIGQDELESLCKMNYRERAARIMRPSSQILRRTKSPSSVPRRTAATLTPRT